MAGEQIKDFGSWVDLEANGASIANNAFAQADDAAFSLSADGGGRPHLQIELEYTYSTAPTANTPIILHAQALDLFGGAADAAAPTTNNLSGAVWAVLVEARATTQRRRFDLLHAPEHAAYWLQNAATGQTISAGWKLRARAWGNKAA